VHPSVARAPADANAPPKPNAQQNGWDRQNGGESQQLSGHQQQSLALGHRIVWHHGQIHENSGQIKQTSKPAGHEDDVKGFDPEHAQSVVPSVKLAKFRQNFQISLMHSKLIQST
jgi:hypothetical protein